MPQEDKSAEDILRININKEFGHGDEGWTGTPHKIIIESMHEYAHQEVLFFQKKAIAELSRHTNDNDHALSYHDGINEAIEIIQNLKA